MANINLFNSLSRNKELFLPLDSADNKIKIYSCGPTVYDYPHIGNMRAYVFSDLLKRILIYNGYSINHVMNITDVGHLTSDADEGPDKLEQRANSTNRSAWEMANFYTDAFMRFLLHLNINKPNTLCKATEHIKEMIDLIQLLEVKGYTYKINDGIYFDTNKFPRYGELAKLDIDGIRPGARVHFIADKKNTTDFALWKFSRRNDKRQMEWSSPWGIGFPGWHIECSAMAMLYLGNSIDIHTGGIDHIPVHHTNEIAQSEAATGFKFVNYWLHCAFLNVEGKKMSKSIGNIYTIDDIISRGFDPLSFRYLLLTSHYRSQANFTWDALKGAEKALNAIRSYIHEWPVGGNVIDNIKNNFINLINDDLAIPQGLAYIWQELIPSTKYSAKDKKATLIDFDRVLGLELLKDEAPVTKIIPSNILKLASEREILRAQKKWDKADELRETLFLAGYVIEDTPSGPKLKEIIK